jgi:hypothetical protein
MKIATFAAVAAVLVLAVPASAQNQTGDPMCNIVGRGWMPCKIVPPGLKATWIPGCKGKPDGYKVYVPGRPRPFTCRIR